MTTEAPKNPPPGSILDRLDRVEKKKSAVTPVRRRPGPQTEDRLAIALRSLRRSGSGDDPAAEEFREDLFAELRKLIPIAIRQAKSGKPALLRILTRYSK